MPIATMTSKGQVTIPKRVREALLLDAGVEVEFTLVGDGTAVLRARHPAVASLFGAVAYSGPSVSIAEMDPGSTDDR